MSTDKELASQFTPRIVRKRSERGQKEVRKGSERGQKEAERDQKEVRKWSQSSHIKVIGLYYIKS